MGVHEHRKSAPTRVRCAVVTVSDSRTLEDDPTGDLAVRLVEEAGHEVAARHLLPDEPEAIKALVRSYAASGEADCVLLCGGTGISSRDSTPEALRDVMDKTLDGFGELFRALSFQEIGPAAMLSRATAGTVGRLVVFALPGSPKAVELGLTRLVLPEIGHVVREARR